MRMQISIIIVYYSGLKDLLKCLKSIRDSEIKATYEIIVVNNSRIKLKLGGKTKLLQSPRNVGYGAGNNLGAGIAKGKYLMILNPDVEVKKGSVDILLNFLENKPEVAIAAPLLVDKRKGVIFQIGYGELTPLVGIFTLSFIEKIFPNNAISQMYWCREKVGKTNEVAMVPGSAFLIKKRVFDRVGGFDENIFLYFEEPDISRRIRDLGYKIFLVPRAVVVHKWKKRKDLSKHYGKSRFYYFQKHFGYFPALIVELFATISLGYTIVIAILIVLLGYLFL